MQTIGTCSNCGGPVQVPTCWGGSIPPVPTCAHCGAQKKQSHGPVIEMEPSRNRVDAIGIRLATSTLVHG